MVSGAAPSLVGKPVEFHSGKIAAGAKCRDGRAGELPLRRDHDGIECQARAALVAFHSEQRRIGFPLERAGVQIVELPVRVIATVNTNGEVGVCRR